METPTTTSLTVCLTLTLVLTGASFANEQKSPLTTTDTPTDTYMYNFNDVYVFHDGEFFSMKGFVEEKKMFSVLVFLGCQSPEDRFIITFTSSDPAVCFLPEPMDASRELRCDFRDEYDAMSGGKLFDLANSRDILGHLATQQNSNTWTYPRTAAKVMNLTLEADVIGRAWLTLSANHSSPSRTGSDVTVRVLKFQVSWEIP